MERQVREAKRRAVNIKGQGHDDSVERVRLGNAQRKLKDLTDSNE